MDYNGDENAPSGASDDESSVHSDVDMEENRVTQVVNEVDWVVTTPADPSVISNSVSVPVVSEVSWISAAPTVSRMQVPANSMAVNDTTRLEADEPMNSMDHFTEDVAHEGATASDQQDNGTAMDVARLPRSRIFSEMQERSDSQLLNLIHSFETQVRDEMNDLDDTRIQHVYSSPHHTTNVESSTHAAMHSTGQSSEAGDHNLRAGSSDPIRIERPFQSDSSAQLPTHPPVRTSRSSENTDASRRARAAAGTSSSSFSSGNGGAGNPQADVVNISRADFMRFIRSIESLSASVHTIVGANGPNPGPGTGRPRGTGNNSEGQSGMGDMQQLMLANSEPTEDAQPKVYRRKPVGVNLVHDVMRSILVDFRLRISRRKKQFVLKDPVPAADVDAFSAGMHNGPSLHDLRLDWTQSMASLWNSTAIYLLAKDILQRIINNSYPAIKYEGWMTENWFFQELKDKLTSSREDYENALHSNEHETDVAVAERRARHTAYRNKKAIRNRRSMRRKTLYNWRLNIVYENLGTDPAWEHALRIMQVAGDLAMSDDETDTERSTRRKKVVRRVEKPWASSAFKSMTHTIDLYYSRIYPDGYHKPGPGPRDRLATIVSATPRPTPKALPKNCYSSMYINSLTPYQSSRLQCKRDMIIPLLPLPPS